MNDYPGAGACSVRLHRAEATEHFLQADMPAEVVPKLIGKEEEEEDGARMGNTQESQKLKGGLGKLKVCILTADFWGLKSAGGTATAYHLLAAVLAKQDHLDVRHWTR